MSELKTVTPMDMIGIAVQKGVDTDKLEKLMDLHQRGEAIEARKAYFLALAAFQAECPVLEKTKVVKNKDGSIRYKYAPLESIIAQVKPLLYAHGFSYTFDRQDADEVMRVICTLHHVQGHSESATRDIPAVQGYGTNDAQNSGSAHTYGRRLSFTDVTGITSADEDDDAQLSGRPTAEILLKHNFTLKEWLSSIMMIKDNLSGGEGGEIEVAAEAYAEMPLAVLTALNLAPSKGGIWTTDERKEFKENKEFRDLVQTHRKDSGWHDDPENKI